jgi:enoyl-CoA hydratase
MPTVRRETIEDGIDLVTLDRPSSLNSMNNELIGDLHDTLDAISHDRDCRVVILTGEGRGFCAGLDLRGFGEPPHVGDVGAVPAGMTTQQHIAALVPKLRALRQPVIAAVNGPAAGGGFALALASDVRVCSESAKFNVAFVRIGLSGCDIGVSWMLPRLVGASKAFEMLLTGRIIDAHEAERMGLVIEVVPDGTVVDRALETARLIKRNSPIGVWFTKEVMWSNLEIPSLQAGIDIENRNQILASQTADMREAMSAFLEKRDPEYKYR